MARQYISFIEAMQKLDIDLAGEFLSLGSQLLLIKSRTILPPPETEEEEEEEAEEDVSLDLIRKLLDYKKFKDRAQALNELSRERSLRFGRPKILVEGETEEEPLRNLELWDLVLLWSKVSKSTRLDISISILYHDIPLEIFVERVLSALAEKRSVGFRELIGENQDRGQTVGTLLAILQLSKEQKVQIEQEGERGEIRIHRI
jgi:segregation and condensation protein A